MCDTILASPAATTDGVMLFGKNSDRQRNEAHLVERRLGGEHAPGETVACTYIEVPQARRTHAALFCRPFWTWGPEMGANACGVVIGNEAVHTRGPPPETPALIGMDLAGLALQRAASAEEAVAVIADLLAAHGQGGDCGHLTPSYYNNSYIVADRRRAFVMETVGREWMVEEIASVRAISNIYRTERPERTSAGLDALIAANGWPDPRGGYAAALADTARPDAGEAKGREVRAQGLLDAAAGGIDAADMMRILRDHGGGPDGWRPAPGRPRTVCMHASDHDRGGQTTGSMVSELRDGAAIHWVTGTAAPCLSIFKPLFLDSTLPDRGPPPTGQLDGATLWWAHEALHRLALRGDFAAVLAEIAAERDAAEAAFRRRVADVAAAPGPERDRVVAGCWREASAIEDGWRARLAGRDAASSASPAYLDAWTDFDRLAEQADARLGASVS